LAPPVRREVYYRRAAYKMVGDASVGKVRSVWFIDPPAADKHQRHKLK
jgi:hypothetical protein